MTGVSFLSLAYGPGMPGFIEPRSMGANGIFLGCLQNKDRSVRIREIGGIVKSCGLVLNHAATFSSLPTSFSTTNSPFSNLAPALTSATK
ncbi:hypothetical protein BH23ACT11_BH23ACT11_24830 [soil metagenome]